MEYTEKELIEIFKFENELGNGDFLTAQLRFKKDRNELATEISKLAKRIREKEKNGEEITEEEKDFLNLYRNKHICKIKFQNVSEKEFFEQESKDIICSYPNINKDDAERLLVYITRKEAHKQGILDCIELEVNSNETAYVADAGPTGQRNKKENMICKVRFGKELIEDVNNSNQFCYVLGIGHLIEAACHEVKHAKQSVEEYSLNPSMEYRILRNIKEDLVLKTNYEFYTKNYRSFAVEKEAFLNGRIRTKEELQSKNPKLYSIVGKICEGFIKLDEDMDLDSMKTIESGYEEKGNAEYMLSEMVDKIVEKYPNVVSIIPALEFIYNKEGTKKHYSQLIEDREEKITKLNKKIDQARKEMQEKTGSEKVKIRKAIFEMEDEVTKTEEFYDDIVQSDKMLIEEKEQYDKSNQSKENVTTNKQETIELTPEEVEKVIDIFMKNTYRNAGRDYGKFLEEQEKIYQQARETLGEDTTKEELDKFIAEKEYNRAEHTRVYFTLPNGQKVYTGNEYDSVVIQSARKTYSKEVATSDIEKYYETIKTAQREQKQKTTKEPEKEAEEEGRN